MRGEHQVPRRIRGGTQEGGVMTTANHVTMVTGMITLHPLPRGTLGDGGVMLGLTVVTVVTIAMETPIVMVPVATMAVRAVAMVKVMTDGSPALENPRIGAHHSRGMSAWKGEVLI